MTRCARGRERESPEEGVKEKKRRKVRKSWRAFLVTFRLSEPSPSSFYPLVSSSPFPILPLLFVTPCSGKPVASPPALTPSFARLLPREIRVTLFRPTYLAKRNSAAVPLRKEPPERSSRELFKKISSLLWECSFFGFQRTSPLMSL